MPTANPILVYSPAGAEFQEVSPAVITTTTVEDEDVSISNPSPILDYAAGGYGPPGFTDDELPRNGYIFYWPSITSLTGSNTETDLEAQPIYILPADSLIFVVIMGRGGSEWKRVVDAGSPVTNADAGTITPIDYNASTRPYILTRQGGW